MRGLMYLPLVHVSPTRLEGRAQRACRPVWLVCLPTSETVLVTACKLERPSGESIELLDVVSWEGGIPSDVFTPRPRPLHVVVGNDDDETGSGMVSARRVRIEPAADVVVVECRGGELRATLVVELAPEPLPVSLRLEVPPGHYTKGERVRVSIPVPRARFIGLTNTPRAVVHDDGKLEGVGEVSPGSTRWLVGGVTLDTTRPPTPDDRGATFVLELFAIEEHDCAPGCAFYMHGEEL